MTTAVVVFSLLVAYSGIEISSYTRILVTNDRSISRHS